MYLVPFYWTPNNISSLEENTSCKIFLQDQLPINFNTFWVLFRRYFVRNSYLASFLVDRDSLRNIGRVWGVQRNTVVIPKTSKKNPRDRKKISKCFYFQLAKEDMDLLNRTITVQMKIFKLLTFSSKVFIESL